mmetsp:Transcript_665/g.1333  ORF Transcript_665/g.1333 Transcript_665/m.1333 type:complete len:125 (-) Transcript_665:252-626(-)
MTSGISIMALDWLRPTFAHLLRQTYAILSWGPARCMMRDSTLIAFAYQFRVPVTVTMYSLKPGTGSASSEAAGRGPGSRFPRVLEAGLRADVERGAGVVTTAARAGPGRAAAGGSDVVTEERPV